MLTDDRKVRPMATTTKKTTARTVPAKKPAGGTPTKKATRREATSKATPLLAREPVELLETAGYAVTGVVTDVVELARRVPGRVETFRSDVEKAAFEAPSRVRTLRQSAPAKLEASLASLRDRVTKDVERSIVSVQKAVDSKAAEGRKTLATVAKDERVVRVLDQASNTRSQLKAALTSVTKTAAVAGEAAGGQARTAKSQVKAAATSAKKSAETLADAATDGGR